MTAGVPGKWYGPRASRPGTRGRGRDLGSVWIPHTSYGPAAVATQADIGSFVGVNCDDAEALVAVVPVPRDLSVDHPILLRQYVVFDGVSDGDTFELDLTYAVDRGADDPVHVVPTGTDGVTDAPELTIIEAFHESRLVTGTNLLAATIAGGTLSSDFVGEDHWLLILGLTVSLGTMTQAQFILLGSELQYTKRFF